MADRDAWTLYFGWAGLEGGWHRIEALTSIGGEGVSAMNTSCGEICHPRPIELNAPPGATLCRVCSRVDSMPGSADDAWGEPDDALHMVTSPDVRPRRFGHYHGSERAEFRIGDPYVEGHYVTWPYTCSCGQELTVSEPRPFWTEESR